MEPITIGILGIVMLFALMGIGVHIAIALIVSSLAGLWMLDVSNILPLLGTSIFSFTWVYEFTALPLFILMSVFALRAGLAEAAYNAIYKWVQKIPGSLAIATTYGCAVLGAVSGSSMAVSAVFGRISLPIMQKYGYSKSLSLGCVAAAGTFACMIPPSGLFIVYGIFTETSIGRLFLAGVIPGLITAIVYSASIIIRVKRNPELAPQSDEADFSFKEKLGSLNDIWPTLVLVVTVLGGIYSGLFTVTEGAAVGCVGTFLYGLLARGYKAFDVFGALRETAGTTSMTFLIIVSALFFARFLQLTHLPVEVAESIANLNMPREMIILGIFAMYFVLGMMLVPSGMMAVTLPVVFPIVLELGYSPIWFGVIIMKASEIAAVTPPVGLNVYVLKGVAGKSVSLEEIFKGIWPFVTCDIVVLIMLITFPQLCLWLPDLVMGN